jgi:protein-L-isoaspartate O-methyltransferase
VTLLSLDTAGGDLEEVCAPAPVVAAGCGHAVVTWLEVEGLGAPLCTAPPELSRGAALGPLAAVHAVQFATFAPLGAPWRLAAGETRRLRGAVTPSGVDVSLQAPLACQVAGPHAHSAPDYHASMLNDTRRNAAYAAGLAHAVASHRLRSGGAPPRVLDIGAGAGLLSMLAARTGAADVLACERDAALARCAAADVEANGLGAAITVAAAHSRDLGRHNAGAFDVIVQEVFGSDALSEGVLPTLAHASALLATGGVMVPARLRVRAALVCSGALRAVLGTARAGRDSDDLPARAVAAYDALAPLRCSCHLPDVAGAALLTDAAEFVLDLCARPLPQQGALTAHARGVHAGEADAVLFWFAACFDGGAQCATGPTDGRRQHWQQTLFRLPAPRRVALGDAVALQMRYCADRTSWAVLDA